MRSPLHILHLLISFILQDRSGYWQQKYQKLLDTIGGTHTTNNNDNDLASAPSNIHNVLKEQVGLLNAHFRFIDSPDVAAFVKTRRARAKQQRSAHQPQALVTTARNTTQPSLLLHMVDPTTMEPLGPPAPTTDYMIDDIYSAPPPEATGLGRHHIAQMFPDFQRKIAEVSNQSELLKEVAKTLMRHYEEAVGLLHRWDCERQQYIDQMPQLLNSIGALIQSSRYVRAHARSLLITGAQNQQNDVGRDGDDDASPEEVGAPVTQETTNINTVRENNIVIPLKGTGYMGREIEVWRVDVHEGNSIGFKRRAEVSEGGRRKYQKTNGVRLPVGSYFFKRDVLALGGLGLDFDGVTDANKQQFQKWVSDVLFARL